MILVVDAAFALNNLAPYLGLNYVGAMTMYSGLAPGGAKDAADLMRDFLGRDWSYTAFEKWLKG